METNGASRNGAGGLRLRVATYNTHKCRGMDGRVRPARIAAVLQEIGADIVALQEIVSRPGLGHEADQARYIAEALGLHYVMGANRPFRGGLYGNVVLSRFPIRMMRNYDLSIVGREERGCLRADIALDDDRLLHIFNVHLGTAVEERRHQGVRLLDPKLLNDVELAAPRLVLGDFNEWVRGLATRLLSAHLQSAAMNADAKQTEFCTYLSAILLGGLLLNAVAGLWWADPLAGLIMVPIIAKEGIEGLRGDPCCG